MLARDRGICQLSYDGCTRAARIADHKVNVKSDASLEFDVSNGQAVCEHCHKIKTQREARDGRAKVLRRRDQ